MANKVVGVPGKKERVCGSSTIRRACHGHATARIFGMPSKALVAWGGSKEKLGSKAGVTGKLQGEKEAAWLSGSPSGSWGSRRGRKRLWPR
jgi:hypothetical protein